MVSKMSRAGVSFRVSIGCYHVSNSNQHSILQYDVLYMDGSMIYLLY